ncbi:PQQ-dependent sugar dehydrogenase [Winogradskyella rapida]|uniref:PQQ-dependent sugar dehydrogenase n=1 Tax=Winogradskyella rapida TaxID=549701 RepID=A0ABW3KMF4_9FLAO
MKTSNLLLCFLMLTWTTFYGQTLELELFASGLNNPVNIKHDGSERLYVAERDGYIKVLQTDGNVEATPFLDIDAKVSDSGNERGLLGLAFHPNYTNNGYIYVNYINNSGNTIIARYTRSLENELQADPNSELIILTITQPYSNHNGGEMAFGADNYLYISTGDGGSAGDPQNYAQNKLSLLGKMLRIDVDTFTASENYSIPTSNPFINNSEARPEIWAYGLRNPWKFSFDRLNGALWIADVGQSNYEEINYATESEAALGLNYGWKCYEGNTLFSSTACNDNETYTFPVGGYNHFNDGLSKCSITGGYVYRGTNYPNFQGAYFFADYCSEEIGYLVYDNSTNTWTRHLEAFSGNWSAFGEDLNGELYIADLNGGLIYKLKDPALGLSDLSYFETSVYPNPAQNNININFGSHASLNAVSVIQIYDLQGQNLKSISVPQLNTSSIDISSLANGIYIIKISTKNGQENLHQLIKY